MPSRPLLTHPEIETAEDMLNFILFEARETCSFASWRYEAGDSHEQSTLIAENERIGLRVTIYAPLHMRRNWFPEIPYTAHAEFQSATDRAWHTIEKPSCFPSMYEAMRYTATWFHYHSDSLFTIAHNGTGKTVAVPSPNPHGDTFGKASIE